MEQFKGEVKISTKEYKRLLLSELALKEANVLKIATEYNEPVYEYLTINKAIEEISEKYDRKRSLINKRWDDSIKRNEELFKSNRELITENKNLSNRIIELEKELVRYRKKRKFLWLFKI